MKLHNTHIWDPAEYAWYLTHPDMLFTVPVCGEFYRATRYDKIPLLVMPEAMLHCGTLEAVRCPVCAYVNTQYDTGVWDELAGPPQEKT
jgi:hypothetical protein